MLQSKQSSIISYLKAFALAVVSSLAVIINNGSYAVSAEVRGRLGSRLAIILWQISSSFKHITYSSLLLVIMLFVAYVYLIPKVRRGNIKWGVPFSLLASLFLLLCDSYANVGSWNKVFHGTSAQFTSLLRGIGIATMAFFIFDLVNRISIETVEQSVGGSSKKLYLKLAVIMLACWVPYMVIMAPGAMATDTTDQFAQAMNNPNYSWTNSTIVMNEGDSLINNHHPVVHTLLLGLFLKIGELFGSYFVGMELYCIVQSIAFAFTLCFIIKKLREYGMSCTLSNVLFAFFTLCPLFPLWGMTTFKDTPFTILLPIVVILLYDAFKKPEDFKGKKYASLIFALLGLMLVRNNGFYMVLAIVPFVFIHFIRNRKFLVKIMAVLLIPLLIFKVGYTGILFDAVGIREGSTREMLSVPFQQTARYIIEYGDEITDDEANAICQILGNGTPDLQKIADQYEPCRSDHVKRMYNKYATTDDLIDYFKVWAKQLTKHPDAYVQAFLHLNYSWFDFRADFDTPYYDGISDKNIPEFLDGLDNPAQLKGERAVVKQAVNILSKVPLVNCIFEFSFYTWLYVIAFLTMLMRKKHKELLALLPIYANYAICFVGPVAYMRYVIPMMVCSPLVLFIAFSRCRKNKDEKDKSDSEDNEIWIK